MKMAFVKQGFSATWASWESVQYSNPMQMLESFRFQAKILSLLVEFEADVWVIEGLDVPPGTFVEVSGKEYVDAMLKLHTGVPWSAVPWEKYDVVISTLPIVPERIIRKHPNILWCYFIQGHVTKMFSDSLDAPYGAYDLFLNEMALTEPKLRGLPQAVSFPYPTNPDLIRDLIRPTHEPAVFLDTRLIKRESPDWFRARCDLPIKHSSKPAMNSRRVLAQNFTDAKTYLTELGLCKYFLLCRKPNFNGQAALEAASLGLIVVSGPGIYPSALCLRESITMPNSPREGVKAIKRIEADPDLQKRLLAHQDKVLRQVFWKEPIEMLYDAIEMKQNGT